jgi:hypothetical protein
MAENHISRRPPITRKPHSYQADEDLVARFICHANSTHVSQCLWRGLLLRPFIADSTSRLRPTCLLEAVMNSIRNGLGIGETEIARKPSRPWNPHFYAVFQPSS